MPINLVHMSAEGVAAAQALLDQASQTPSMAAAVAADIAAIPNVPANLMAIVNLLPEMASDQGAYTKTIADAQNLLAELPTSLFSV